MFRVAADSSKNLLSIAFSGDVGAAETGRCVDQVEVLLGKLSPGFTLFNDLSALEKMEIECVPHLTRSMDLCTKAGITRIVRVIPDPKKDIGLNILSRFHYPRNIQIITCETMAEAKKILNE